MKSDDGKNKAIFLDRDGTINIDRHYLYKTEEFELLPGVVEGLQKLQKAGFLLIVITNQSGIGRGYYTEDDFHVLNQYMIDMLEQKGVHITDVFYCPHLPDAKIEKYRIECECRKPKLGMFFEAAEKWNIDFSKSWAIGDKDRDCKICDYTSCRGVILSSGIETEYINHSGIFYANNFSEAIKHILDIQP